MSSGFDWNRFKALTLDCYGTLIDWETGILQALQSWREDYALELGDEAILTAFAQSEARHEKASPGAPYPEILQAVFRDLAEAWCLPFSEEDASAFAMSLRQWPPFPDTPKALRYLKQHFKLVVVSNVDRESFEHTQPLLGVTFDAVITAADVGSYKPDPKHFLAALDFLAQQGITKDQVLHVAQSLYHDISPAQELGLATLWVNRRQGKPGTGATELPSQPVQADLEVPDLAKLVKLHKAAATS